ncbi:hypothetical protein V494_03806 [Pseudogymnoascus sp. VKM F-4513 (FW-928)]|nr:hypothetical protein V494_03806 [Pseudogymnoascus sp. VKM F-4513 (FW-928)]
MQFSNPLFVFLSLLGVSSACLVLEGRMDQYKENFSGKLVDNNVEVCKWDWGALITPSRFASCKSGFAAYITQDATIVGYSNGGNEHRFKTEITVIPPVSVGLPIEFKVEARNYDC